MTRAQVQALNELMIATKANWVVLQDEAFQSIRAALFAANDDGTDEDSPSSWLVWSGTISVAGTVRADETVGLAA